MGKFPTKAALTRRIGLISWPHALCLASRDACQASNSIFAEKTSIQRRGKRPSFPRMVNSPRETRVAKKTRHNWGVNECLAFSMPSQSLSGPSGASLCLSSRHARPGSFFRSRNHRPALWRSPFLDLDGRSSTHHA